MKISTLLIWLKTIVSCILISSTSVYAADCSIAMSSINQVIHKADSALDSKNFDKVSDIVDELKVDAQSIINAADSCDCDDAYYSGEEILDHASEAYMSDDISEAQGFILSLKRHANLAKKHAKDCGVSSSETTKH